MGKSLDDARLDSQIIGLMKPSGDGDGGGRQLQTDKKLRLSLSVSRIFTQTPCSHPLLKHLLELSKTLDIQIG